MKKCKFQNRSKKKSKSCVPLTVKNSGSGNIDEEIVIDSWAP